MKNQSQKRLYFGMMALLIMFLLLSSCKPAGKAVAGKATSVDFGGFSLMEAGRASDTDEIVLVASNAGNTIEGVQVCAPSGVTSGNDPPELRVANTPSNAQSFVLVMEDLGSTETPFSTPLVHWVVWDIPVSAEVTVLDVSAGVTGNNEVTPPTSDAPSIDYDNVYTGPCPDTTGRGDLENHKYIFTAYALPVNSLDLNAESSANNVRSRILGVTGAESLDAVPHVVLTAWYPANPTASDQNQPTPVTGTDTDGDGTLDDVDECPGTPVPFVGTIDNGCIQSQVDSDLDGVCSTAKAYGGWCSSGLNDNCPSIPNVDQIDTGGDGVGDACDTEQPLQLSLSCAQGETEVSFTQWVSPDDGFLVMDRDNDGIIQAEDFFGASEFVKDRNGKAVANGFEDLALLDTNGDGVFNKNDPRFAELQIWKDTDTDGVADADTTELLSLAEAGVAEVRVNYYETGDAVFQHQGTFKSTRAVELENRLQELIDCLDTEQTEITGSVTGDITCSALIPPVILNDETLSDGQKLENAIQEVTKELEVENNRVMGTTYFASARGKTGSPLVDVKTGGLLMLDLDGTNVLDLEEVKRVTFCIPTSICGNGLKEDEEVCDDRNTATETVCTVYGTATSFCEFCSADCLETFSFPATYCGDGIVNGPEQCDSQDAFDRELCVAPGEVNECTFITLSQSDLLAKAEEVLAEILPEQEKNSRIRDLLLSYFRSLNWGVGK